MPRRLTLLSALRIASGSTGHQSVQGLLRANVCKMLPLEIQHIIVASSVACPLTRSVLHGMLHLSLSSDTRALSRETGLLLESSFEASTRTYIAVAT